MRPLPLPVPLFLLLSTTTLAQTVVSNYYWQDYTSNCEASCLTSVFNVQQCSLANTCNSNNCLTLDYSCLCGTASWLNTTSKCIGDTCGADAVRDAASIVSQECKAAGVKMAISEDEIIQLGLAVAPSSTSPPKPTGTSSSAGNSNANRGGLSTELQVIIGVVTSIVGLLFTIVGVFFGWKQYKHLKAQTPHAQGHPNIEAASSTTTLTRLPDAPTRGSSSDERQLQGDAAQPLPSPQAVAAALRRVDS
jgi:hypothetical protein